MQHGMFFIGLIVFVALAFDFMNGFHDAANSIATVVSTRVLRPQSAVMLAAFFNFIAFMFFGHHVADTIGKGVVDPAMVDPIVIFSALMGALVWNLITWYYGIPSSSSHALVGGLVGGVVTKSGWSAVNSSGMFKIGVSIVLSPLIGFALAFAFMGLAFIVFYRFTPRKVDRWGRRLQLISASLYSLGHGGNDAQKTMGIVAALLFSEGWLGSSFSIPFWIVISCQIAMALGTLFGGWRIVETMGMRITKLKPIGGFCAEMGGAFTLFVATSFGIPVSTTHTITGSIMGVGAVSKLSAVRWGVARRIVWAWVITIPAAAVVAAVTAWVSRLILG